MELGHALNENGNVNTSRTAHTVYNTTHHYTTHPAGPHAIHFTML